MTDELPDLLEDPIYIEFRAEARDLVERVRVNCETWEPGVAAPEVLSEVLRHLHTIKGNSAMFELSNTSGLAHKLESQLIASKDDEAGLSAADIQQLLAGLDHIDSLLTHGDQWQDEVAKPAPEAVPVPEEPPASATKSNEVANTKASPTKRKPTGDSDDEFIRVSLDRVNSALSHTWEMFLLRNQLSYLLEHHYKASNEANYEFQQKWEVIDSAMRRNISELEGLTMGMRMRSVSVVYERVQRTTRAYLASHHKKVRILRSGDDIEVDKQVVDLLSEPIVHLVRNALDHGLEEPEERTAAGKPAEGSIELNTELDGDHVTLTISDDGRGIDVDKVVEKARALGIEVDSLQTREEQLRLVFHSGLSTKSDVTSVSGRGVGTDAVRAAVTEMGGTVHVASEPGQGTTFVIRLPLRMSVINALLFGVNDSVYAASVSNVIEVCRVDGGLHAIDSELFFEFRGDFIPCLDARPLLSGEVDDLGEVSLVVISHQGHFVALRVSHVLQHVELVLKPLPALANAQRPVSGYSILHTGEPVFVLDLEDLASMVVETSKVSKPKQEVACAHQ